MKSDHLIAVHILCQQYQVEMPFFAKLQDFGLIEIHSLQEINFVNPEAIAPIEKALRLHQELELNLEGIDIVFNLLRKIEDLQAEVQELKSRLNLYEKY
jgi:hypothetical protein